MARQNLSKNQRIKCYSLILERGDPEVCSYCGKTCQELGLGKFDKNIGEGGLEIHHTSYDVSMTDIRFQKFMCHSCNHLQQFSYDEISKYDRELSASHKSNLEKEPRFRRWFANYLKEHNYKVKKKEVKRSGAYISGANVTTVDRWIEPLVSEESPLTDSLWIDGQQYIVIRGREFKHEDDENISIPSIDEFIANQAYK